MFVVGFQGVGMIGLVGLVLGHEKVLAGIIVRFASCEVLPRDQGANSADLLPALEEPAARLANAAFVQPRGVFLRTVTVAKMVDQLAAGVLPPCAGLLPACPGEPEGCLSTVSIEWQLIEEAARDPNRGAQHRDSPILEDAPDQKRTWGGEKTGAQWGRHKVVPGGEMSG
jgi:hypothetical protein